MAHQHLRRERTGNTLQTGTLVHEVYLRLIESNAPGCKSPEEFLRIASRLKAQPGPRFGEAVSHVDRQTWLTS